MTIWKNLSFSNVLFLHITYDFAFIFKKISNNFDKPNIYFINIDIFFGFAQFTSSCFT